MRIAPPQQTALKQPNKGWHSHGYLPHFDSVNEIRHALSPAGVVRDAQPRPQPDRDGRGAIPSEGSFIRGNRTPRRRPGWSPMRGNGSTRAPAEGHSRPWDRARPARKGLGLLKMLATTMRSRDPAIFALVLPGLLRAGRARSQGGPRAVPGWGQFPPRKSPTRIVGIPEKWLSIGAVDIHCMALLWFAQKRGRISKTQNPNGS